MSCCTTAKAADLDGVVPRPHRKHFFQWIPTDDKQHVAVERAMLKPIDGQYEQRNVAGVNMISSTDRAEGKKQVLLIHGFAGGMAQWVPNWTGMTKHLGVHAIDLPGFGRSERPHVSFKGPDDAVAFFLKGIDAVVDDIGQGQAIDIVGHSFGAYLAAVYATKNPSKVRRLVLADPWGVPAPDLTRKLPFKWRMMLKLGFEVGNPLSFLRGMGPWGPGLMPKYRPDFADRWAPFVDANVFYDYVFHSNAREPVGEKGFAACAHVGSGLYARKPLIDIVSKSHNISIPLCAVYGAHTWMDKAAGLQMLSGVESRGGYTKMYQVPDAGHQVNVDNHEVFNQYVLEFLLKDDKLF